MVVAAYGLILPQAVLDIPRFGCINIHASLLPRWRGARTGAAGDPCRRPQTGVCIMQMDAGLDSGPVLLSAVVPIGSDDTRCRSLHDKLAATGARLVIEVLAQLPLTPQPQPEGGITYAAKINKSEAVLDWHLPAEQLARQVRAFDPVPGATCVIEGKLLKVWRAQVVAGEGLPGMVLAADRGGVVVACGQGALRLTELQKAGGKRLPAALFLAGTRLLPGVRCWTGTA
jgi:methionyl-tRNA formyltransferase